MFRNTMAGAVLAVGIALAAAHPAAAQTKQPGIQTAALSNVTSPLGEKLVGMTCGFVWEVDTKVAGGAFDYGAARVKFSANGNVLAGTWEGVPGKVAHDAPHAALFQNPSSLLRVAVTGNMLEFTSRFPKVTDKGIRWSATIRQNGGGIELVSGRFTPKDVKPDWSDGSIVGACK